MRKKRWMDGCGAVQLVISAVRANIRILYHFMLELNGRDEGILEFRTGSLRFLGQIEFIGRKLSVPLPNRIYYTDIYETLLCFTLCRPSALFH
jgi:hypothetical protein